MSEFARYDRGFLHTQGYFIYQGHFEASPALLLSFLKYVVPVFIALASRGIIKTVFSDTEMRERVVWPFVVWFFFALLDFVLASPIFWLTTSATGWVQFSLGYLLPYEFTISWVFAYYFQSPKRT